MMAVLVNPGAIPRAEIQLNDIQTAARSVGQEINILNASTIRDIDAAFAKLIQMRVDALLVATDAFFFTRAPQLVVLAARHAIPTVYFRREFAAAGGLMSYAANPNESYRLLGVFNGTMADYLVPMAREMPDILVEHVETPELSTRLGAKGVGEGGLIGAMGSVWVAVNDALKPLGAKIRHQPFTPERVLDALARARDG
jgi:ABC-type uncharacterized transport system substrate-binding protein